MRFLYLLALVPTIALGDVQYIEKDAKAPFTGYLFSPDKELEIRKTNEDYKTLQLIDSNNLKILDLTKTQLDLTEKQVDLWRNQSQALSKQLVEKENSSFWKQTLFFGLGAIVTTVIVFGVNKASK